MYRNHSLGTHIGAKSLYICIRGVKVRKSFKYEINAYLQHFTAEMYRNRWEYEFLCDCPL